MIKKIQALGSDQRTSTTSVIPPQRQNEFPVYQKSGGISVVSLIHIIWIFNCPIKLK